MLQSLSKLLILFSFVLLLFPQDALAAVSTPSASTVNITKDVTTGVLATYYKAWIAVLLVIGLIIVTGWFIKFVVGKTRQHFIINNHSNDNLSPEGAAFQRYNKQSNVEDRWADYYDGIAPIPLFGSDGSRTSDKDLFDDNIYQEHKKDPNYDWG